MEHMYIILPMIGILIGFMSGLLGIGGAIIMVPILTLLLKYDQHLAQGTALAVMIPPVGILAAYEYYKSGYVNIPIALLIAAGFVIGALVGAKISIQIDGQLLKKIFGFFLLAVSIKIILGK